MGLLSNFAFLSYGPEGISPDNTIWPCDVEKLKHVDIPTININCPPPIFVVYYKTTTAVTKVQNPPSARGNFTEILQYAQKMACPIGIVPVRCPAFRRAAQKNPDSQSGRDLFNRCMFLKRPEIVL
jgi:hypothetical protein